MENLAVWPSGHLAIEEQKRDDRFFNGPMTR
jgi:hypothetical protein